MGDAHAGPRPTVYLRMPPGDGEPPSVLGGTDLVWLPAEVREHGGAWLYVRLSLTTADTYELGKLALQGKVHSPVGNDDAVTVSHVAPGVYRSPSRRRSG